MAKIGRKTKRKYVPSITKNVKHAKKTKHKRKLLNKRKITKYRRNKTIKNKHKMKGGAQTPTIELISSDLESLRNKIKESKTSEETLVKLIEWAKKTSPVETEDVDSEGYIINNNNNIFQDENCVCNIYLRGDKIVIPKILKKSSKGEYSLKDLNDEYEAYAEKMAEEEKACAFFSMISNIGKINQIELVGSGCILNFLLNILKNLKDSEGNSFPNEKEIILSAEQWIDGEKVEYSEESKGYVIKGGEQPVLRLVEAYKQIGFEEMTYENAVAQGNSEYYNEITKEPKWMPM